MWSQLKRKIACIALLSTVLASVFAVFLPSAYNWMPGSFTDTNIWQQYKVRINIVNSTNVVTNVTDDTFQFYTLQTNNAGWGAYLWSVNSYSIPNSVMSVNVTVPDSNEVYNFAGAGIALVKDPISNYQSIYNEWDYHDGYVLYLWHPRTGSSGATTYATFKKVQGSTITVLGNSTVGTIYNVRLKLAISSSAISAYYSTDGATWNLIATTSLDANIPSNLYILLGGYGEVNLNQVFIVRDFNEQQTSLIQTIQSFVNSVNWGETIDTVYAGYILGAKTKADLKNAWLALTDPVQVLQWASTLIKLGIEDETKIKWALDNTVMLSNGLPKTRKEAFGKDCFSVYDRGVLYAGLYYAKKYNYQTSKWNVQTAYNSFKYAIQHGLVPGAGVLWVYGDGTSYTINYGPRHYDEAAQSLSVYLIFYDLGIQSAMDDAVSIWNWVNNNLWTGTYFKYALNWDDLECAVGGFYQIVMQLWQRNPSIGYINRLEQDMEYRFLANRWNSPQWGGSTPYFAVLHAAYSNNQRRLENTIMAWSSLMGVYNRFNSTEQQQVIDLLQGYSSYPNPAWWYLLSSSGLYDATLNQFKWWSNYEVHNDATAYGTALLFFMGMIPQDGSLAVPLEEYRYEYIQNMFDPELFHLDLSTRTVTLSVFLPGSIKFIYGSAPVTQTFSKSGVWQVTFSSDWNSIVSATYVSALPRNRRYLGEIPISLVFTVAIYSSPMGITFTVNSVNYVTPYEKTVSSGTVLQIEFPASQGGWTWQYWNDGVTSRTRTLNVTKDTTLIAYYAAPLGIIIQPPPVEIVPPQPPSAPAPIDISSLPHLIAVAFGMPDIVGQLLLGIVLLLAVLLPIAVATRGRADSKVYLIVGIPVMCLMVALGWFPVWVLLVVVLLVAAMWSGQIKEWLT